MKPKVSHILSLAALMAMATACKKPTEPNSNNTNTQVTPTRDIVIDWNWDANIGWAPPPDSIRYYTKQNDVRSITIHLFGRAGPEYPVNCGARRPATFHRARVKLQECTDIDTTMVGLSGTFRTPRCDFTSHDDTINDFGITWYDKAWFEKKGITFLIGHYSK